MKTYRKPAANLFILLLVDQITKLWARTSLSLKGSIPVIDDFFHLTYVENRGAAFGILQGKSVVFALISISVIVMLLLYYRSQKQKEASHLKMLLYIITAIIAGAIGNLIDRTLFGFVTDFIDFNGIWKFVFNVADIYVVCATILLALYILKFDKSEES